MEGLAGASSSRVFEMTGLMAELAGYCKGFGVARGERNGCALIANTGDIVPSRKLEKKLALFTPRLHRNPANLVLLSINNLVVNLDA